MKIKVLDKGFIRLVDTMGNDSAIVDAARISYGVGTRQINKDRGLIRRLMRDNHTSPFEMCEIKLHCKMPIFIARQWIRHRTANVNEYSARYSIIKDEFYIPEREQVKAQSKTNKQGSDGEIPDKSKDDWLLDLVAQSEDSFEVYNEAISVGISRETARIGLPLNTYTEWYWKIDLHNLLHFLELRLHEHAQWEIRQYGIAIKDIVKQWVPFTWEAFKEYRYYAVKFSRTEHRIIQQLLAGIESTDRAKHLIKPDTMADSEWSDFMKKIGEDNG